MFLATDLSVAFANVATDGEVQSAINALFNTTPATIVTAARLDMLVLSQFAMEPVTSTKIAIITLFLFPETLRTVVSATAKMDMKERAAKFVLRQSNQTQIARYAKMDSLDFLIAVDLVMFPSIVPLTPMPFQVLYRQTLLVNVLASASGVEHNVHSVPFNTTLRKTAPVVPSTTKVHSPTATKNVPSFPIVTTVPSPFLEIQIRVALAVALTNGMVRRVICVVRIMIIKLVQLV